MNVNPNSSADRYEIPEGAQRPMEGVTIWKNPLNKFLVFQLYLDADPVKRNPEYKKKLRASMPYRKYMQEYEISWETWEGLPVYEDYKGNIHGVQSQILPVVGLPLFRGWDFGLTPACVVAQLVEDQLRVLMEFVEYNMGAARFVPKVLNKCSMLWPRWGKTGNAWIDVIDPSGFARKDTDETSCADVMYDNLMEPEPGAIAWETRRDSVEYFLVHQTRQGPGFQISVPHCPTVVRGFQGGYQYPERVLDVQPRKVRPLKNEFSHPHDALQMITSKIRDSSPNMDYGIDIPEPQYNFGGG